MDLLYLVGLDRRRFHHTTDTCLARRAADVHTSAGVWEMFGFLDLVGAFV